MAFSFRLNPELTTPSSQSGIAYSAQRAGEPNIFHVAGSTRYKSFVGLVNEDHAAGLLYDGADYEAVHDFWAYLIDPTAWAEGRSFYTLNTYDLGYFTFGFLQFAAHADDFRSWFRRLLALPEASDYFPDLVVRNDHICQQTDTGSIDLEILTNGRDPFRDYFNPSLTYVEHAELLNGARLIHWTSNNQDTRDLQVEIGVGLFKRYLLKARSAGIGVDGAKDSICAAVCDVMHEHGEGALHGELRAAVGSSDPMPALLEMIGNYDPNRPKRFMGRLAALTTAGIFGKRQWNATTEAFEPLVQRPTAAALIAPAMLAKEVRADGTVGIADPQPGFTSRAAGKAVDEWSYFGNQTFDVNGHLSTVGHKEGENPYYLRVGVYWRVGTGDSTLNGRNDVPWSAAFISWVMRVAGAGTKFYYSAQHSVYISRAIRDQSQQSADAGYWCYRLNEIRPAVGDIVCWARQAGIDYDHQNGGNYMGHSDVVVAVRADAIDIVGGNVGDSVSRRILPLAADGFLAPITAGGELLFGLMKCRIP